MKTSSLSLFLRTKTLILAHLRAISRKKSTNNGYDRQKTLTAISVNTFQ